MSDRLDRRRFLGRSAALISVAWGGALAACSTAPSGASAPATSGTSGPATSGTSSPAASGAAVPAQDLSALVSAARQEGQLLLYAGMTAGDATAMMKAFTDEYGIKAEMFQGTSNQVLQRYQLEVQAKAIKMDVIVIVDPEAAEQLVKDDMLLRYLPPEASALTTGFSHERYQIFGSTLQTWGWNTAKVTADQRPKRWEDWLAPHWKGKLGLPDASTSLPALQWYTIVRAKLGVDFVRKLGQQQPFKFVAGHSQTAESLSAGEVIGAPNFIFGVANRFKGQGAPVDFMLPDPTPILEREIGIAPGAPHPNAAKLFVNYMLSKKGQEAFQATSLTFPPRKDVRVAGLPDIASIKVAQLDVAAYVKDKAALQKEFSEFFKK